MRNKNQVISACKTAAQDRPGLPDARDPAGHLRRQRQPRGGRGRVQGPVLVDDAFTAGTHEDTGLTAAPPLGRHPGLLRPPAHQRGPRGPEQRHPERQDPREGLQEHRLFQHDDLPDLRQTRPANRHHLNAFTHAKQRKASEMPSSLRACLRVSALKRNLSNSIALGITVKIRIFAK